PHRPREPSRVVLYGTPAGSGSGRAPARDRLRRAAGLASGSSRMGPCRGWQAAGRRPPWPKKRRPRRRSRARPPSPRRSPVADGDLVEVVEVLEQGTLGRGAHAGLVGEGPARDGGDAVP